MSTLLKFAAAIVVVSASVTARSAPIILESFDYSNGSLSSQNGGTGWSSGWAVNNATVSNGEVVLPGIGAIAQRTPSASSILWPTDGSTGYMSFTVRITGATTTGTSAAFATGGGTSWGGTVSTSGFQLSGTTLAGTVGLNQTYLLVFRLTRNDAGNDAAALWVNPVSEASAPLSTASAAYLGAGATHLQSFQLNSSSPASSSVFDNVRMGTDFVDVVPEPTGVCALATLGLIGVARRRRVRTAD